MEDVNILDVEKTIMQNSDITPPSNVNTTHNTSFPNKQIHAVINQKNALSLLISKFVMVVHVGNDGPCVLFECGKTTNPGNKTSASHNGDQQEVLNEALQIMKDEKINQNGQTPFGDAYSQELMRIGMKAAQEADLKSHKAGVLNESLLNCEEKRDSSMYYPVSDDQVAMALEREFKTRREIASTILGTRLMEGYELTKVPCLKCGMPLMKEIRVGRIDCQVCPQLVKQILKQLEDAPSLINSTMEDEEGGPGVKETSTEIRENPTTDKPKEEGGDCNTSAATTTTDASEPTRANVPEAEHQIKKENEAVVNGEAKETEQTYNDENKEEETIANAIDVQANDAKDDLVVSSDNLELEKPLETEVESTVVLDKEEPPSVPTMEQDATNEEKVEMLTEVEVTAPAPTVATEDNTNKVESGEDGGSTVPTSVPEEDAGVAVEGSSLPKTTIAGNNATSAEPKCMVEGGSDDLSTSRLNGEPITGDVTSKDVDADDDDGILEEVPASSTTAKALKAEVDAPGLFGRFLGNICFTAIVDTTEEVYDEIKDTLTDSGNKTTTVVEAEDMKPPASAADAAPVTGNLDTNIEENATANVDVIKEGVTEAPKETTTSQNSNTSMDKTEVAGENVESPTTSTSIGNELATENVVVAEEGENKEITPIDLFEQAREQANGYSIEIAASREDDSPLSNIIRLFKVRDPPSQGQEQERPSEINVAGDSVEVTKASCNPVALCGGCTDPNLDEPPTIPANLVIKIPQDVNREERQAPFLQMTETVVNTEVSEPMSKEKECPTPILTTTDPSDNTECASESPVKELHTNAPEEGVKANAEEGSDDLKTLETTVEIKDEEKEGIPSEVEEKELTPALQTEDNQDGKEMVQTEVSVPDTVDAAEIVDAEEPVKTDPEMPGKADAEETKTTELKMVDTAADTEETSEQPRDPTEDVATT